jgi:hypothetical protein
MAHREKDQFCSEKFTKVHVPINFLIVTLKIGMPLVVYYGANEQWPVFGGDLLNPFKASGGR